MLELDPTLIYQIIGFFVLLLILNRLFFRPILKVLDERAERIEGAIQKAADIDKGVEDGLASYRERINEARQKGQEERSKIKSEALKREKEILEAASSAASEEVASMRVKIRQDKAAALEGLKDETRGLSRNIAERLLDRNIVPILIVGALTFLPSISRASEEAGHESVIGLWMVINFLVLVGAIYLLWKKVLKGLLEKRSADIEKAIDDAKKLKEEADKRAGEYRKKLDEMEKRIEEIAVELRSDGEAEKKKILEEAEKAAGRIREQAKHTAAQEIKKARKEIRGEVADMAVKMAEEVILREMKPEDQARLIKDYLARLRLH